MGAVIRRDYEYIVIGLGGLGTGALYWLARRAGADVLGLEQYQLGHDYGASEDHSRIVRLSYDQPVYADLARHSYAAWREVEAEIGEPLLVITGGLDLFPEGGPVAPEGHVRGLKSLGIPYELLDAGRLMQRFPQFQVDSSTVGIFQEQGGLAPASKCMAAHLRLARGYGATVLDQTPVTRVVPNGDGMEVHTADAVYRCRRLIVTTDAWTNEILAPLGLQIPLTSTQEQVGYYASPELQSFSPERFPVWIWYGNPCFYGIPVYGEERGVKIAQDIGGREVTPQTRTFEPDQNTLARVHSFIEKTMPTAMGPIVSLKTCMYTMPPDRNFIIGALPEHPQILIGQGAAHAFKFASMIGRILSEIAVDGETQYAIEPFAADRPILRTVNPERSFEAYLMRNGELNAL